jgi:Ca-activated chloride channel family protein
MPTLIHQDVLDALDRLHPQRYTAVGSGIIASLQAIFPELELGESLSALGSRDPRSRELGKPPETKSPAPPPVAPGSFTSAVIVLLSDGRTNAGVPPLDAARIAADRGVRVFTIGFGSPQGSTADFGNGFMRMQPDAETLKEIAAITKASHFNAESAAELKEIYKTLTTQFVAETKRTELTAFIAAPALILLVIAMVLSLLWSNRMT